MNLRYHPASEEADTSDHVLLEHWATFSGRQLALRVTTADADSPDTVTVHVRYGSGQAGIVISARRGGSERQDVSVGSVGGVFSVVTGALSTGEHVVEPLTSDFADNNMNADKERDEGAARASSRQLEKCRPDVGALVEGSIGGAHVHCLQNELCYEDQAGKLSQTAESARREGECTESAVLERRDVQNCGAAETAGIECAVKSAEGTPGYVGKQSHVGEGAERSLASVPRPAKEAAPADEIASSDRKICTLSERNPSVCSTDCDLVLHASESEQAELYITRFDLPPVLDDKELEKLLRDLPFLRVLSIEWRLDRRKLDVDVVGEHCRNLVEIDLTRFRLDTRSLQQLCAACPGLEVVKLPRKCDDSHAEVLLRSLPKLRVLDLSHTRVTGKFLEVQPQSLETLVLSECRSFRFNQLDDFCRSDPEVTVWKSVQELNLSCTYVTSADLANVLSHFPSVEGLSLAHCDQIESCILSQMALEMLTDLDLTNMGRLRASDMLSILVGCPLLKSLIVSGCLITESFHLRQIDESQAALRLRCLNVSEVKGLATCDLTAILNRSPQLKFLVTFDVEKLDLTACLAQLSECVELEDLDVSRSGKLIQVPLEMSEVHAGRSSYVASNSGRYVSNGIVNDFISRQIQPNALTAILSNCPKLRRLALNGCHVTDSASLRQLAVCVNLRVLDISRLTTAKTFDLDHGRAHCQSVEAADLAVGLTGCPELESLFLEDLEAPLEHVIPPTGLPKLTYLVVKGSRLRNNSLRCLHRMCPDLDTLLAQNCKWTSEDGLMSYLPRLQHLSSLDLMGTSGVTDAVLGQLKECRSLRALGLDGAAKNKSITMKGLEELVLDCSSLRILSLDASKDTVRVLGDMLKLKMPLHRLIVISFSEKKINNDLPKQQGPVIILPYNEINWAVD